MAANRSKDRLRDLSEDLRYDAAEEGDAATLKWILWNILDPGELAVLLLYVDTGSLRKVGELLRVSHTTAAKVIRGIRAKVITAFNELKGDDDLF